jgi:ankyrin repeat protein
MSLNTSPRAFDALVKKDLDALSRTSHEQAAVRARDQRQQTPLHWAARLGVTGATAILTQSGQAEINAQDDWGDTPLHLVIRHRRPLEDVTALLRAGANPNVRNQQGLTPAYEALCLGQESVFDAIAAQVTWDAPANSEQTLRQCVARQRPAWQTKLPLVPSLGEAVKQTGPSVPSADIPAPVAAVRRSPQP